MIRSSISHSCRDAGARHLTSATSPAAGFRHNPHRTSATPRRVESRSDGFFLALAIGTLLLASLLTPRAPREPLADPSARTSDVEATAVAMLD